MKIKQNVPLVSTENPKASKEYYEKYFGFKTIFDSEFFVGMRSKDGAFEMSFMSSKDGTAIPPLNEKSLYFCFEVDDVDSAYEALCDRGLSFVQPPTDNPWGDRSAITVDPLGIQVYLYTNIPSSDEFKTYIKE